MYNNPYMQSINQQNMNDRIDNEIERLKQMKTNMQQPIQPITQNFQLAPTNNGIKYVNSIDDVQKELAITETIFINKDYSILWIKNAKGEIRTFNLEEVIPKDEKDIIIENLQNQISELNSQLKEMNYVKSNDERDYELQSEQYSKPTKSKSTSNVSNATNSKSKSK